MVELKITNTKRETALLAQKYIDDDITFICKVAPFENKIIYPKFIDGKTYKHQIYGFKGHHGRNKSRILSAANIIKAIDLGCWLSDIYFSRIVFKDKNPLNYHLDNIDIHYLEYQQLPYKPGIILGLHLGNPEATKQYKRRTKAVVTETNGFVHETMYYRYVYETALGEKLDDKMEIDHIDGNVLNNNITNLRVVSYKENALKSKICSEGNFYGKHYIRYKCPVCGSIFDRSTSDTADKKHFCSSKCNAISRSSSTEYNDIVVLEYIDYNYLRSCLVAGPIDFINIVTSVKRYDSLYVFPIISEIDKLIVLPEWQDVLYYTYCNQVKLGLNRKESPEVIDSMKRFIFAYETRKTQQYIFTIMNNTFIPKYEYLPNNYKFQARRGVSPYDMEIDSDGFVKLPVDRKLIPELHQFIL